MVKRLLVIGILVFTLLGLVQTQAMAGYGIWSAGAYWGTYHFAYNIRGGSSDPDAVFVGTSIQVLEGCLVCLNPGTNRLDVRGGFGGITFYVYDQYIENPVGDRGNFNFDEAICATVGDDIDPLVEDECDQENFNLFWGVTSEDCRNDGWTPFQYLLNSFFFNGEVLTNCTAAPPTSDVCDVDDSVTLYCETNEGCREPWPGEDGVVNYICVPVGSPVAWGDNYTVSENRTLNVRRPGVLDNDSDHEGDPLTASLVDDVNHGSLDLRENGSFTYTPDQDWTGVDSFKYVANDGVNDSNEAIVTINVIP